MLTKGKILRIVRQHADDLKTYRVRRVGIFGSFAKSEQNSKSDIDVLVEFARGGKTFDNYMGFKFFLEKLFHRKVDLVMRGTLKSEIKERVLLDAVYA